MKIAALDLGSNTFLMLVVEVSGGQVVRIIRDELRVTRMAEGVHATKRLQPQALQRAEECLSEYAEIIALEKPDRVVAMATSAARDAINGDELFKIGERYGIKIQIIPGSQEAKISFLGSSFEIPDTENILTVDIGGGSTEVVLGLKGEDVRGISLNIGSVRLTELFVKNHPVPPDQIAELENYIAGQLPSLSDHKNANIKDLVAVAGTATTLAAIAQSAPYSSKTVHGYRISTPDLRRLRDQMATLSVEQRKQLAGMDAKRADVIVAGATILLCLAEYFAVKDIMVSDRGVRFGIALLAEKGVI